MLLQSAGIHPIETVSHSGSAWCSNSELQQAYSGNRLRRKTDRIPPDKTFFIETRYDKNKYREKVL